MERKMLSTRGWLICLVYGSLLTVVLLWVRFPTAKVEAYLTAEVAAVAPGARLVPGVCSYDFPVKLVCDRLTISREQGGEEFALLENVEISPVASRPGLEYRLTGGVYGGTFSSRLKIAPVAGRVMLEEVELANVALDRTPLLKELFKRELHGSLDFHGSWSASLRGTGGSSLQGEMAVRDGQFALRQPILSVKRMEMAPLEVGMSYDNGVLKLSKGFLKGKELNADFAGELRTADSFTAWEVAVNGRLEPQREYIDGNPQVLRVVKRLQREYRMNGLSYMLSGSPGNPRFRFGTK